VGEIQTRSFVTDNITQPWNALKPTAEASVAEGEDLTRNGSYVFSDKTELSLSVNARVEGSDVIVKGSWQANNPVKGFAFTSLWVPEEFARDVMVEEGGVQVFPGIEKPVDFKGSRTFTFRQLSTGKFLFKVTGDFLVAKLQFFADRPEWGLDLRFFGIPDPMTAVLGDPMQTNWKISFAE